MAWYHQIPVSSNFPDCLKQFFLQFTCLNQISSKVHTLQLVLMSSISLLICRLCLPLSFFFLCNLVSKKLHYYCRISHNLNFADWLPTVSFNMFLYPCISLWSILLLLLLLLNSRILVFSMAYIWQISELRWCVPFTDRYLCTSENDVKMQWTLLSGDRISNKLILCISGTMI